MQVQMCDVSLVIRTWDGLLMNTHRVRKRGLKEIIVTLCHFGDNLSKRRFFYLCQIIKG